MHDPFTGEPMPYQMPAGGRGYTRVPSLIGLWSTAPFLLNNTVGPFDRTRRSAARMKVFDASIEQMLWPEKRERDRVLGAKVPGIIDRTTERSRSPSRAATCPEALQPLQGDAAPLAALAGRRAAATSSSARSRRACRSDLLANIKLRAESDDLGDKAAHVAQDRRRSLVKLKSTSPRAPAGASDDELRQRFANLRQPMLALSKCPDFVVNRGHYFGTAEFNRQEGLSADEKAFGTEPELSDEDKRALIAFLKTF